MHHLNGALMHYPWGTMDFIPGLLGRPADGRPVAEYWLGAHPAAPATVDGTPLQVALAEDPSLLGDRAAGAFGPQLPYLMKVLSARHALSLQAHPSRELAQAGYAREEEAGVPRTAPERTYADDWPKPEVMIALTEFHSLSGFRDPDATADLLGGLGLGEITDGLTGPLTQRSGPAAIAEVFLDVLSDGAERQNLVNHVLTAAVRHRDAEGPLGDFARTALELDETFPGDPGILAALLLNRVTLQPGEALFVDHGTMHAHLRGSGIEVMAASDNVVRGGLTTKHIDVDELVRIVDFSPSRPRVLLPDPVGPGVWAYRTPCPEFDVWRVEPPATGVVLPGHGSARILLVTRGTVVLDSGERTLELGPGSSAFLSAADPEITASGDAELFLSAPGVR